MCSSDLPSEADIAATRAGTSTAPIGSPRPVDSVPLPGMVIDAAAAAAAAAEADLRVALRRSR